MFRFKKLKSIVFKNPFRQPWVKCNFIHFISPRESRNICLHHRGFPAHSHTFPSTCSSLVTTALSHPRECDVIVTSCTERCRTQSCWWWWWWWWWWRWLFAGWSVVDNGCSGCPSSLLTVASHQVRCASATQINPASASHQLLPTTI